MLKTLEKKKCFGNTLRAPSTSRILYNVMPWKERSMNSNVNTIIINKYTKMASQLYNI